MELRRALVYGRSARARVAVLGALACLGLLAGCGGGSEASGGSGSGSGAPEEAAGTEVVWPFFGRVPERTHAIREAPSPPFRYVWQFFARQLIEFSPVLDGDTLYVFTKTGTLFAVDIETGKPRWKRNLSDDVSGPALAGGSIVTTELDGTVTALDVRDGSVSWRRSEQGRIESSPLDADGRVVFGTDEGDVVALDDSTGRPVWRTSLGAPVKASPSLHDGVVYVGDYRGSLHALELSTGKRRWTRPTGSGGFYSSPSIAWDRVYEARDDGTVVAADLDGRIDWSVDTGAPIYGSPAATDVAGLGPTIFLGNYRGELIALDATSGKRRWSYRVGGQIPGTPTIVGDTVFTSSFDTKKTTGLDLKTGKRTFTWGSAGYDPVISDGEKAFLTGFQTVWAFEAKTASSGAESSGGSD